MYLISVPCQFYAVTVREISLTAILSQIHDVSFLLYKRKFLRTAIIHVRLNAFVSKGFKCLRMHGVNAHVLFEKKGACKTKIIMYMYFDCMGDFQHAALI